MVEFVNLVGDSMKTCLFLWESIALTMLGSEIDATHTACRIHYSGQPELKGSMEDRRMRLLCNYLKHVTASSRPYWFRPNSTFLEFPAKESNLKSIGKNSHLLESRKVY